MEAITNRDSIASLELTKRVTAVFVASSFDQQALRWLFGAWWALDKKSNWRWHIVVPLIRVPSELEELELNEENFNQELADELQSGYGIKDRDTPCLVFDNFIDDMQQLMVSLKGSEEDRKSLILDIVQFMESRLPPDQRDYRPSDLQRRQMIEQLFDHTQTQVLGRAFIKKLPRIGSALFRLMK